MLVPHWNCQMKDEDEAPKGRRDRRRGRKMKANRRWMRWIIEQTAEDAAEALASRKLRLRRLAAA